MGNQLKSLLHRVLKVIRNHNRVEVVGRDALIRLVTKNSDGVLHDRFKSALHGSTLTIREETWDRRKLLSAGRPSKYKPKSLAGPIIALEVDGELRILDGHKRLGAIKRNKSILSWDVLVLVLP